MGKSLLWRPLQLEHIALVEQLDLIRKKEDRPQALPWLTRFLWPWEDTMAKSNMGSKELISILLLLSITQEVNQRQELMPRPWSAAYCLARHAFLDSPEAPAQWWHLPIGLGSSQQSLIKKTHRRLAYKEILWRPFFFFQLRVPLPKWLWLVSN